MTTRVETRHKKSAHDMSGRSVGGSSMSLFRWNDGRKILLAFHITQDLMHAIGTNEFHAMWSVRVFMHLLGVSFVQHISSHMHIHANILKTYRILDFAGESSDQSLWPTRPSSTFRTRLFTSPMS